MSDTSPPAGLSSTDPTPEGAHADSPELAPSGRTDRELWLETSVVVLIGVIVPLSDSLCSLLWPAQWTYTTFTSYALPGIIPSLGTVVPVLYLMLRSQEPWSRFGFVDVRPWRDSLAVASLLVLDWFFYLYWQFQLYRLLGPSLFDSWLSQPGAPSPSPAGASEYALLALLCAANGFSEEIVMRGYLIPRFEYLLGSTTKSVLLTSLLFAAYHGYQGLNGVINCLVGGLLYGVFFCWLRRIWPLVLAHALYDLIAYYRVFG